MWVCLVSFGLCFFFSSSPLPSFSFFLFQYQFSVHTCDLDSGVFQQLDCWGLFNGIWDQRSVLLQRDHDHIWPLALALGLGAIPKRPRAWYCEHAQSRTSRGVWLRRFAHRDRVRAELTRLYSARGVCFHYAAWGNRFTTRWISLLSLQSKPYLCQC